jgi:hypothetical protein
MFSFEKTEDLQLILNLHFIIKKKEENRAVSSKKNISNNHLLNVIWIYLCQLIMQKKKSSILI